MKLLNRTKKYIASLVIAVLLASCMVSAFADSMFTDVPAGAYYEEPVQWAYENGITTGTSATTFSPGNTCSRAQVVTFLWRAVGSPEPATTVNPFTDVVSTAYYYKAVLWAFENNITTGASATTFGPNNPCTRGHVVTFLWRTEGQPAAATTAAFSDVKSDAYYFNAVSWAVENGITNGVGGGKFAPADTCTRAQIVTFLYRDLYTAPDVHYHSYSAAVTLPSCSAPGYTTYTCACGHSYTGNQMAPTGHTYVAYQCTQCGAIDKSHAYEYLIEWVKANGEVDGAYVVVEYWSGAVRYCLTYSANDDSIHIATSETKQNVFVYSSLYLNDYGYLVSVGDYELFGYVEASEFTENSAIPYILYNGPQSSKWDMIEFSRLSLCRLVEWLDWYLTVREVGITIADLGFTAY